VLNDLDINYFNKTIETVRAIQPEDLQALANKYLQPEDFYELVVY
jgi:predicted Zn-dependent peptidase